MTTTPTILLTGSAGRIGQAVVQVLGPQLVRGFDLVPTPGLTDFVTGDLANVSALDKAMQGMETLIHLAATPDDDDFMSQLLPNNIVGFYNVMEAARQAGLKRLILASSGQVVWYQRKTGPLPISADVQPTPRYWYACTKMFLEAAGRAFSEVHGMQVIVVRLGWCPRTLAQVQEIHESDWAQDVYLSPNDAGRFFTCAARAKMDQPFAVVYATSKPVRTCPYDLELARSLVGFEPQEKWPQGIEIITR